MNPRNAHSILNSFRIAGVSLTFAGFFGVIVVDVERLSVDVLFFIVIGILSWLEMVVYQNEYISLKCIYFR